MVFATLEADNLIVPGIIMPGVHNKTEYHFIWSEVLKRRIVACIICINHTALVASMISILL
jgi:hypothetical protein